MRRKAFALSCNGRRSCNQPTIWSLLPPKYSWNCLVSLHWAWGPRTAWSSQAIAPIYSRHSSKPGGFPSTYPYPCVAPSLCLYLYWEGYSRQNQCQWDSKERHGSKTQVSPFHNAELPPQKQLVQSDSSHIHKTCAFPLHLANSGPVSKIYFENKFFSSIKLNRITQNLHQCKRGWKWSTCGIYWFM